MYDRKVAKAIKQQLKNENEPIANLRPTKANIDLKRALETKLSQLQVKTDRSILEILKAKRASQSLAAAAENEGSEEAKV